MIEMENVAKMDCLYNFFKYSLEVTIICIFLFHTLYLQVGYISFIKFSLKFNFITK